jgi:TEA/ATTS domain
MGTAITYLYIALEKYEESVGSEAQKSGRFTMRNRFISDYIYETTGNSRTPKQVGSRLQQLREICKGDKGKHLTLGKLCNQLTGS